MNDFQDLKLAIEALSGGSNTVILDDRGQALLLQCLNCIFRICWKERPGFPIRHGWWMAWRRT